MSLSLECQILFLVLSSDDVIKNKCHYYFRELEGQFQCVVKKNDRLFVFLLLFYTAR